MQMRHRAEDAAALVAQLPPATDTSKMLVDAFGWWGFGMRDSRATTRSRVMSSGFIRKGTSVLPFVTQAKAEQGSAYTTRRGSVAGSDQPFLAVVRSDV